MKRALGPALSLHQIMGSLNPQLNVVAELQNSGAYGLAEQASRLRSEHFMSTNMLASSQRLSAVAQSAAAMSLYSTEKFGNIRNLSHSFEGGIFGTAKALQGNTAILAAAMGASKLQDQWKAMMGSMHCEQLRSTIDYPPATRSTKSRVLAANNKVVLTRCA